MYTDRAVILVATAFLLACQPDSNLPTDAQTPAAAAARTPNQERLAVQLQRFSTQAMLLAGERHGVTKIRGKTLGPGRARRRGSQARLEDVPIAASPGAEENEPSVAANPRQKKKLVVGYHSITDNVYCHARRSSDGGRTWSAPVVMPQLTAESSCSDPVVAYAPDGSRVYYAYMDIKFTTGDDYDILVSYSADDGATWIGPFIALNSAAGLFVYDKPWLGTADDDRRYVYVTATRFDLTAPGACAIVFTRSTDRGTSFGGPTVLDQSGGGCGEGSSPVVQGSRPSGGRHGQVLAAWYHSGTDGWLAGSFTIRTRHSTDHGATFGPPAVAATDHSEAPFWLGPFVCYERWWGSMYPDVELGPDGAAHIIYTHDPVPGSETAEEGDVRYVRSGGAPYTRWSRPVTVNDDHTVSAQGYAAIEEKAEGSGQSARPHAAWMDHRLPLEAASGSECPFGEDVENLEYDIFYSTRQGSRWSDNVRVSGRASRSDFIFLGDYIDLTATNGSQFAVWTDRRDKGTVFDLEDNVWGSRAHRVQVATGP